MEIGVGRRSEWNGDRNTAITGPRNKLAGPATDPAIIRHTPPPWHPCPLYSQARKCSGERRN